MSVSGSQQEQCTLLDLNSRSIREADCSVKGALQVNLAFPI